MDLKHGSFYRTNRGNIVGPLVFEDDRFFDHAIGHSWFKDGRLVHTRKAGDTHPLDLKYEIVVFKRPEGEADFPLTTDKEGYLFEFLADKGAIGEDDDGPYSMFKNMDIAALVRELGYGGNFRQRIQRICDDHYAMTGKPMIVQVLERADAKDTLNFHSRQPRSHIVPDPTPLVLRKVVDGVEYELDLHEYQKKIIANIAESFAVFYDMLVNQNLGVPYRPGYSASGWPKIGTHWVHRNGNVYEVRGHSNVGSTKEKYPPMVEYFNSDTLARYSGRLDDWDRRMTFRPAATAKAPVVLKNVRLTFDKLFGAKKVVGYVGNSPEFTTSNQSESLSEKYSVGVKMDSDKAREVLSLMKKADSELPKIPDGVYYIAGQFVNVHGLPLSRMFHTTWFGHRGRFPQEIPALTESEIKEEVHPDIPSGVFYDRQDHVFRNNFGGILDDSFLTRWRPHRFRFPEFQRKSDAAPNIEPVIKKIVGVLHTLSADSTDRKLHADLRNLVNSAHRSGFKV